MGRALLALPINIPWKLIAVSPDMMDKQFCNKLFPFAWRSSLAISAFEPRAEDLPENLCEERITYLKVTCTITGYQPSRDETKDVTTILEPFGDTPTEDLREEIDRILTEYFACYGALLNVAVFPHPSTKTELVPATVDFSNQNPGASLLNPLVSGDVSFHAEDQPTNRIVDILGVGTAQLDLFKKMVVTFPSSPRVDAKIVHRNPDSVTMHAFKGTEPVGSKTAGPEQVQIHEISIEGERIDRVVFESPEDQAALLAFTRYDTREVPLDLEDYPHIIDFEPKVRDLYQAATETGEILTSSHSNVATTKSFTNIENTESGFQLGFSLPLSGTPPGTQPTLTGGFSRTRTDTDQDNWAVHTDASRERREMEGTTTQLSQMYNLLTGYHPGTNRLVEFLLARPHVLQPTDFRTFVQGLRAIEGVQEFFLIVARPEYVRGLCIEAFLETGHFPENAKIEQPPDEYEESYEDFFVTAQVKEDECKRLEGENPTALYKVDEGWIIDRRKSRQSAVPEAGWTDGHPGMSEIEITDKESPELRLQAYDYRPFDATTAQVVGRICGEEVGGDRFFERKYRVFTRSEKPIQRFQPRADIDRLLITSRGLCACFLSGEPCLEVVPPPEPPIILSSSPELSIVDEPMIKVNPTLLTPQLSSQTRLPAIKDLLRQVQVAMLTSWRQPKRYLPSKIGFLESEYFKNRIRKVLPQAHLAKPLVQVSGLPEAVVKALGQQATINDALDMDLSIFARRTGLDIAEAARARRQLLGVVSRPGNDAEID